MSKQNTPLGRLTIKHIIMSLCEAFLINAFVWIKAIALLIQSLLVSAMPQRVYFWFTQDRYVTYIMHRCKKSEAAAIEEWEYLVAETPKEWDFHGYNHQVKAMMVCVRVK